MDEDNEAEKIFLHQEKEKRLSELEVINIIGKFSKKNMQFIAELKRDGLFEGNEKRSKKNTIFAKNKTASCEVIFNYDDLDITTKGDPNFCSQLRDRIDW